MEQGKSLSDQLEERMIEFAARIISFTTDLNMGFERTIRRTKKPPARAGGFCSVRE
jgi:hypothetical protein